MTDLILRAVNRLFRREAGGDGRPAFFDIDATYPELRLLDRHQAVIREEMEALLADTACIPKYHEVSEKETYISGTVDPDRAWRVFMLKWVASGGLEPNRRRCPRTAELVDRIPGVLQAFFSILDPGKSIPAHDGPYLGYLRYHLALRVPAQHPPKIRIKDTWYTWKSGESVMFDDSWNHEVVNPSTESRVVLIVDVMRPMGWLAHATNHLLTRVIGPRTEEARQAVANMEALRRRVGGREAPTDARPGRSARPSPAHAASTRT